MNAFAMAAGYRTILLALTTLIWNELALLASSGVVPAGQGGKGVTLATQTPGWDTKTTTPSYWNPNTTTPSYEEVHGLPDKPYRVDGTKPKPSPLVVAPPVPSKDNSNKTEASQGQSTTFKKKSDKASKHGTGILEPTSKSAPSPSDPQRPADTTVSDTPPSADITIKSASQNFPKSLQVGLDKLAFDPRVAETGSLQQEAPPSREELLSLAIVKGGVKVDIPFEAPPYDAGTTDNAHSNRPVSENDSQRSINVEFQTNSDLAQGSLDFTKNTNRDTTLDFGIPLPFQTSADQRQKPTAEETPPGVPTRFGSVTTDQAKSIQGDNPNIPVNFGAIDTSVRNEEGISHTDPSAMDIANDGLPVGLALKPPVDSGVADLQPTNPDKPISGIPVAMDLPSQGTKAGVPQTSPSQSAQALPVDMAPPPQDVPADMGLKSPDTEAAVQQTEPRQSPPSLSENIARPSDTEAALQPSDFSPLPSVLPVDIGPPPANTEEALKQTYPSQSPPGYPVDMSLPSSNTGATDVQPTDPIQPPPGLALESVPPLPDTAEQIPVSGNSNSGVSLDIGTQPHETGVAAAQPTDPDTSQPGLAVDISKPSFDSGASLQPTDQSQPSLGLPIDIGPLPPNAELADVQTADPIQPPPDLLVDVAPPPPDTGVADAQPSDLMQPTSGLPVNMQSPLPGTGADVQSTDPNQAKSGLPVDMGPALPDTGAADIQSTDRSRPPSGLPVDVESPLPDTGPADVQPKDRTHGIPVDMEAPLPDSGATVQPTDPSQSSSGLPVDDVQPTETSGSPLGIPVDMKSPFSDGGAAVQRTDPSQPQSGLPVDMEPPPGDAGAAGVQPSDPYQLPLGHPVDMGPPARDTAAADVQLTDRSRYPTGFPVDMEPPLPGNSAVLQLTDPSQSSAGIPIDMEPPPPDTGAADEQPTDPIQPPSGLPVDIVPPLPDTGAAGEQPTDPIQPPSGLPVDIVPPLPDTGAADEQPTDPIQPPSDLPVDIVPPLPDTGAADEQPTDPIQPPSGLPVDIVPPLPDTGAVVQPTDPSQSSAGIPIDMESPAPDTGAAGEQSTDPSQTPPNFPVDIEPPLPDTGAPDVQPTDPSQAPPDFPVDIVPPLPDTGVIVQPTDPGQSLRGLAVDIEPTLPDTDAAIQPADSSQSPSGIPTDRSLSPSDTGTADIQSTDPSQSPPGIPVDMGPPSGDTETSVPVTDPSQPLSAVPKHPGPTSGSPKVNAGQGIAPLVHTPNDGASDFGISPAEPVPGVQETVQPTSDLPTEEKAVFGFPPTETDVQPAPVADASAGQLPDTSFGAQRTTMDTQTDPAVDIGGAVTDPVYDHQQPDTPVPSEPEVTVGGVSGAVTIGQPDTVVDIVPLTKPTTTMSPLMRRLHAMAALLRSRGIPVEIDSSGKLRFIDDKSTTTKTVVKTTPTATTPPTTTTTTTMATTTTVKATSTVETEVNIEALCENPSYIDSVGYAGYPGQCNKVVQCFKMRGGRIYALLRDCPYGLFWEPSLNLCKHPAAVESCYDDPCVDFELWDYKRGKSCRAYSECYRGVSYPQCCQLGFEYRSDHGCVPNSDCQDPCETPETITQKLQYSSCKFLADSANPFGYQTLEHDGVRFRACAPGTMFSTSQCGCVAISSRVRQRQGMRRRRNRNRRPKIGQAVVKNVCMPDFYMNFNDDVFKETSGTRTAYGVTNVMLSGGAAEFKGQGNIILWGFMDRDLGKEFAIRLRFKVDSNRSPGNIISNCGMHGDPTVKIRVDKMFVVFLVKTISRALPTVIRMPYRSQDWNDVILYYNGDLLICGLNNRKIRRPLSGEIETRSNAIYIGGCPTEGNGFEGLIDEIAVYSTCIPQMNGMDKNKTWRKPHNSSTLNGRIS